MARLNEAPISLESVESLKRRFIRQNRELARSNSIQSVKIRNLEGEISRLLAENVTLSEEIIQLRTELECSAGKHWASHALGIKSQMEAKLQELNGMLTELGNLNGRSRKGKSQPTSPKQSPIRTARRRSVNLAELLAAQEGRLPTIIEDKSYPRRTLEPREVQVLLEISGNDSPDIGPPPKSSFDCNGTEDFISTVNTRQSYPLAAFVPDDAEIMPDLLAGNFDIDTRRRRRSSQKYIESTAPETTEPAQPVESKCKEEQIVRTGVKRKLAIRDLGESTISTAVPSTDQFCFSRKDSTSHVNNRANPSNQPLENSLSKLVLHPPTQGTANGIPVPGPPIRKILGPKTVNTDPVVTSPEKSRLNAKDMKKSELKEEKTESRLPSKSRSRITKPAEHYVLPVKIPTPVTEAVEICLDNVKLEPKTPAPNFDAFSPASSRPSKALISKDTPPPPDFNADGAQNVDKSAAGRTSRRARSNVSYAEPSLVSKMRRPTKTLIDAVVISKDDGRRQSSDEKVEGAVSVNKGSTEAPSIRMVLLTRSDPSKPAPHKVRQTEPISPLRDRETDHLFGKAIDPPQGDLILVKETLMDEALPPSPQPPSQISASATLSTLMASSQERSTTPAVHRDMTPADAAFPLATKPNDSESIALTTDHVRRPAPASTSTISTTTTTARPTTSRRRQTLTTTTKTSDVSAPTSTQPRSRPTSLEASTTSSTISSSSSSTSTTEAKDAPSSRSKINEATQMQAASFLAGATAATDVSKRRAERVAARRRSMMF